MSTDADDFYVGYLPIPSPHKRVVVAACTLVAAALATAALTLASVLRDGGDGVWDTGHEVTLEGTLHERPYPMLHTTDGAVVMLVEAGKRGAQDRCGGLGDAAVRCRGWAITRDGRRVLELAPEPDAIQKQGTAAPAPSPAIEAASEFKGEIVDYKCYLGAMKPGDGKGHKACATLCISRGIPPVLVFEGPTGREYLLLTDAAGEPISAWAAEFAGEPVVVRGARSDNAGLAALRVDSISRAGP